MGRSLKISETEQEKKTHASNMYNEIHSNIFRIQQLNSLFNKLNGDIQVNHLEIP